MKETRPQFIIRKYRSILLAAVIVEAVNFIVSLMHWGKTHSRR